MKLKPAPHLKVRDPQTMRFLPAEGAEIPDNSPNLSYWYRRLAARDVLRVECAQIPDSKEQAK